MKAWLEKPPRFTLHFTPTGSSWLNLVERWFRDLTEKCVRRGDFATVPLLIATIEEYLAASNADPKPFVWHASAQAIIDKLARCKAIYEQDTRKIKGKYSIFPSGHPLATGLRTETSPFVIPVDEHPRDVGLTGCLACG